MRTSRGRLLSAAQKEKSFLFACLPPVEQVLGQGLPLDVQPMASPVTPGRQLEGLIDFLGFSSTALPFILPLPERFIADGAPGHLINLIFLGCFPDGYFSLALLQKLIATLH